MDPELSIGLVRAAGYSTYAAIATLIVAAIAIALFSVARASSGGRSTMSSYR